MNKLQQAAESLLYADFSMLPVNSNKRPAISSWAVFQEEQPTQEQAEEFFRTAWGLGVICGKVSGGLECIDFDSHDKNINHIFTKWGSDSGIVDIIHRNKLYVEQSMSGGYHVIYRYDAQTYDGSQKLAFWESGESMIETKGEGGYVIVSPTDGYKSLRNTLEDLRPITWDEREYMVSYARQFNESKKVETVKSDNENKGYDHTDPVSWFNWNKSIYAKQLLKENGWTVIRSNDKDKEEEWIRPGKTEGTSATWGYKHNSLYVFSTSVEHFKNECYYTPFQILCILRFKNNYYSAIQWIISKYFDATIPYLRVGTNYFKKVKKLDRFNIWRVELKSWTKDEIKQDEGPQYNKLIPRFDDFTIYPDNFDYHPVIENCYNLYKEFTHKPIQGDFKWSELLMRHIFGEQYNLGLRYLQALYLYPMRSLPILVLVSRERQTGKTTFLNWLNMIFGDNMVNISPEDLTGSFNHIYATSNVIAVEETLIEKAITVEKLKAIATAKFTTVNQKFVSQYKIPFYGKIILASNNEDKFARIDEEEIRFFVRKVGKPTTSNHAIEDDLNREIPAFLYYLTTLPAIDWSKDRSGFTPEEIVNDSLRNVKKESRSGLYKDLNELIIDSFLNHPQQVDSYMALPSDIKERWFKNNTKIDIQYIRSVLKNEYKMKPADKTVRYFPFGISVNNLETKVGAAFTFYKSDFCKINEGDEDFVNNCKTDILPF